MFRSTARLSNIQLFLFVRDSNLKRRHLTDKQRVELIPKLLPLAVEEAKERQGTRTDLGGTSVKKLTEVGRATEAVGKQLDRSYGWVEQARTILDNAPEILAELDEGKTVGGIFKELKREEKRID